MTTASSADESLQCPRCCKPLREQRHARAVIDHCEECSGNFFDEGEMLQVLGKSADPEVWSRNNRTLTPCASEITCPRCHKRMHMHPLADQGIEVDVDFCPGCGGIWLDGGEVDSVMQIGARKLTQQAAAQRQPQTALRDTRRGTAASSAPELIEQYLSLFPKSK